MHDSFSKELLAKAALDVGRLDLGVDGMCQHDACQPPETHRVVKTYAEELEIVLISALNQTLSQEA
jgi:hypothetical protein